MKIGIILYQNMRYAPFVKVYENLLSGIPDVDYDIIYVNRNPELKEIQDSHHICLPWRKVAFSSKVEKVYNTLAYPSRVRRFLNGGAYDFLIVLTTMPAVLLEPLLRKKYKGRYLVDIRDYTQEKHSAYFKKEERVLRDAAMRIVSSPDFLNFLPKTQYDILHNLNVSEEAIRSNRIPFRKAGERRIILSYIGSICYAAQCRQLIDLVKKDPRFEMRFYGNESVGTAVTDYVKECNDPGIQMMGPFRPEDKPQIFAESDLVFNCYGNDSTLVKYAISNKHYDGAFYRRPLLVSPGTTMKKLAGDYAYALDLDTLRSLDGLYEWYRQLDEDAYVQYADRLLQDAAKTNRCTLDKIRKLLQTEEV